MEAVKIFEDLVRRIFGPSTALFPLLFGAHWLECKLWGDEKCALAHSNLVDWLLSVEVSDTRFMAGGLLLLFGTGYVMSTLHSLFFDHYLHKGFDSLCDDDLARHSLSSQPPIRLHHLRQQAIAKLNRVAPESKQWLTRTSGDYLLYEIIGGIDKGSTTQAVDSAKTYGIVTIGAILAILSLYPCLGILQALLLTPVIFIFWLVGRMLVKAQYRWRSVRHYGDCQGSCHLTSAFLNLTSHCKPSIPRPQGLSSSRTSRLHFVAA